MTRIIVALVVLLGTASIAHAQQLDSVAASIGTRLETGRQAVAVVDFTDLQGNATELGRYLAEELSVALALRAKGYRVIDRTHLKAILQEHKLAASGVIDPATARQLGKLAGVDTLITGTLTPLGDSVRLSVKALDAETAAMVAATALNIPRTSAIDDLLGRAVAGGGQDDSRAPAAVRPAGQQRQRIQADGVTIELERCSKDGRCQLFVTAAEDTNFWTGATAWDESGSRYEAQRVRVANQEGGAQLVAGVRTPLLVTFSFSQSVSDGVSARAASRSGSASTPGPALFSALELEFRVGLGGFTKQRLRNISLQ